jgi:NAD(P)-dependent dehydrogenase (short-subunit alcohol dehydrogenase family)
MNFEGKVSLVTGGSHGIGAATALCLARDGAHVAICARHEDEASREVTCAITALGRHAHFSAADMGRPEDVLRCVEETRRALGDPDIVVHSAGAAAAGNLLEVCPEEWYAAFDVHVHAVFHLCRATVPAMRAKREGAIILVSSVAGLRGCPNALAYGVVKGALPQFARGLARDLAGDNIRVNCVAPGIIRTRFHDHLSPEQARHNVENRIPLHREGTAEQVAEAITFLAGNDFITGETMTIDGGMTMRIA